MQTQDYPYSDVFIALIKIYSLADHSGNVFYIGCTTARMESRLANHISEAKRNKRVSNQRKNDIIRKLDFSIVCTIIDTKWVTAEYKHRLKDTAVKLEKEWIKKYTELGYQLCNGRLPIIKKSAEYGPEYIGKTLTTYARPSSKDNSWIKIETSNEVKT